MQCGHEMSYPNDKNGFAGKLVRLRVSKRIVRLPDTSQCIEQPIEIPLPRPKIRMNYDAVRYLKSIPKFRSDYISREIFRTGFADMMSPCNEYFGNNTLSPNVEYDIVSSLIQQVEKVNLSSSTNTSTTPTSEESDLSADFIHYCLFILHGIYDAHKILNFTTLNEFKVRILMLNYYVKEAFSLCLAAAKDTISMHQSQEDVDLGNIMLTSYVIRLFEYFTKDASIVPIHRTDLKYLIHSIFIYFIENSLPLETLESYFLNNIDHYLFGLAFVLFFNNNNTKLERKVQQKYSHLFSGCISNENIVKLCEPSNGHSSFNTVDDDTDTTLEQMNQNVDDSTLDFELIFKHVSTAFKTIICQRLIEFDNELN